MNLCLPYWNKDGISLGLESGHLFRSLIHICIEWQLLSVFKTLSFRLTKVLTLCKKTIKMFSDICDDYILSAL